MTGGKPLPCDTTNIGPAYWKGEESRRALVAGRQKLTDEPWIAPYRTLARWRRYLGEGYGRRSYRDSQALFAGGRAAVYPAGGWEIAGLGARAGFAMGAFPPPVRKAGDQCYISDHPDMGIGLNAGSRNKAAARPFWTGSPRPSSPGSMPRGAPSLERASWDASVAAITGASTAEELGVRLQEGFAGWYTPHR